MRKRTIIRAAAGASVLGVGIAAAVTVGGSSGSTEHRHPLTVAEWSTAARVPFVKLATDMSGAPSTDGPPLTAYCNSTLRPDVDALKRLAPFPTDPALWKLTIHDLDAGVTACQAGDMTGTATGFTAATNDLNTLSGEIGAK